MDFITHALTGKIISLPEKNSKKAVFWIIFFSILADIPFIPFYLILGYEQHRPFFIPLNSDWIGANASHPFLTAFLGDIPHSFIFAFLIILPIILLFKLPKTAFLAYIIHLMLDIPFHTEEWAIKPFYPFSDYSISGFSDAWAWPINYMVISWASLLLFIALLNYLKKKNADSSNSG